MKKENIYNGNVEIRSDNQKEWKKKLKDITKISGDLSINSNAELKALKSVGGDLYINSNAELKALKSVGGDLYIYSNAEFLEKQLWKHCKKNRWYINEKSSDWLINKCENFVYKLNNVEFKREWFLKIKNDEMTAEEVFSIDNIEHRRIAYEFMDKGKMKQFKDYKVLDEKVDSKGNLMKIISFTVQNMNEPLKFYNCICPSSGREYFIGTDKDTCLEAKNSSFGLNDVEFIDEW